MFRSEKPVTAITVLIERLTKEEYAEDDLSDLPTLIEAIGLQRSTGPAEAARAIRKKLKYGNPHRQLRALTILDDLIRNAGTGFQQSFADEPLLERLRLLVTDSHTDSEVRARCRVLYRQWATIYKNTPGMHDIATLYKQLPQRKRPVNKETSKVLRETEMPEADYEDESPPKASASVADGTLAHRRRSSAVPVHTVSSQASTAYHPSTGGSVFQSATSARPRKDRNEGNSKGKPFSLEKEIPQINQVISSASIESTNLMNAMMHINREKDRVSDNPNVKQHFETCKRLRRQTYLYCILVVDEKYLGSLLHANDQLSDALVLYEQLDRSFHYDSDSEDYEDDKGNTSGGKGEAPVSPSLQQQFAGFSLGAEKIPAMPPRRTITSPTSPPRSTLQIRIDDRDKEEVEDDQEDEDDENDPFADRNAVSTPKLENDGLTWS